MKYLQHELVRVQACLPLGISLARVGGKYQTIPIKGEGFSRSSRSKVTVFLKQDGLENSPLRGKPSLSAKLSMKKNVIPPTQARNSQTLPRLGWRYIPDIVRYSQM